VDDDLGFTKKLDTAGMIGMHVRQHHAIDIVRPKPQLLQPVGQVTGLPVRPGRPWKMLLKRLGPASSRVHCIGMTANIEQNPPIRPVYQVSRDREFDKLVPGRIILGKIANKTGALHLHSTKIQNMEFVAH